MARVLVVDDEVRVRELLRKALEKNGYESVTVPDAQQALALVFKEPFDLVLLDLRLARESGLDVLKKIRESQSTVPVVIYSGAVTDEIEKEMRKAGANEVISKVTEIPQLIAQIGKIIKARGSLFPAVPGEPLKKTVLIVDDEAGIRDVLSRFFAAKGYVVMEAESGARALELAAAVKCSVALLDMKMPGMDGLEVLEQLKAISPETGVLMVTGEEDDDKVRKAVGLGAYGYVLKPFDFLYLELVVSAKLAIAQS